MLGYKAQVKDSYMIKVMQYKLGQLRKDLEKIKKS